MPQDGRLLEGFVEFLERAGAERITTELALEWARLPVRRAPAPLAPAALGRARVRALSGDGRPRQRGSRHGPVCLGTARGSRHTSTPTAEIAALMAAAGELRPALRAARHQTLIGLLAVTGCAPAKRSRSTAKTSTFAAAWYMSVQASRRGNARSRCTRARSARLREYARQRDARFPTPSTSAFFISARGRRMGRAGTQPDVHQADPRGRSGRPRRARQTAPV